MGRGNVRVGCERLVKKLIDYLSDVEHDPSRGEKTGRGVFKSSHDLKKGGASGETPWEQNLTVTLCATKAIAA